MHRPYVGRHARELLLSGAVGTAALGISLAIALSVPEPNFLLLAGVVVGTIAIAVCMISTRYEVTLAVLALYLGMVDGVLKLATGSQAASSIRDIVIGAISLGALTRLVVSRERVRMPPLSGWMLAFVALVLVEAANPETLGIGKILAGFRQHLEWIPFFFFGYLVMRSSDRFRKFFLILGVIALANGIVSTDQTQMSPASLAKWGPGYAKLVNGGESLSGRVYYDSSGQAHVRPPGLGSDQGFGGAIGVLALPGTLALLAIAGLRKRSLLALLLCVGALVAIATSLQRTDVLGAVIAVASFALLSASSGRRMGRPLVALLVVAAIGSAAIVALVSATGSGLFSRYSDISPSSAASTSYNYRAGDLGQIPTDIQSFPFGTGLGSAGAARFFDGGPTATINGHIASAESQYNYVTLELGLPGLLLWCAFSVTLLALVATRLRKIENLEMRVNLAAVFAGLIAITVIGFAGPTMSSLPFGPYFWFAVGIAAYWLCRNSPVGRRRVSV